jgi:hypothetical protein
MVSHSFAMEGLCGEKLFSSVCLVHFLALALFAQNSGSSQDLFRIVGIVETLNGQTKVESEDSQSVSLILAPDMKTNFNARKDLSDIKPGCWFRGGQEG